VSLRARPSTQKTLFRSGRVLFTRDIHRDLDEWRITKKNGVVEGREEKERGFSSKGIRKSMPSPFREGGKRMMPESMKILGRGSGGTSVRRVVGKRKHSS